MANSQSSGVRYSDATIDTAPGASGYWCEVVGMDARQRDKIFWISFVCEGYCGNWIDNILF